MPTVVDPKLRPSHLEIYEAIRQAWLHKHIGPSKKDLHRATGYSTTTIMTVINDLHKKGHVTYEKFKERGTRPVDLSRKLSATPVAPWDEDLDTPQIWL
jgi:DNA-binding MarR family transcriptional regulator